MPITMRAIRRLISLFFAPKPKTGIVKWVRPTDLGTIALLTNSGYERRVTLWRDDEIITLGFVKQENAA